MSRTLNTFLGIMAMVLVISPTRATDPIIQDREQYDAYLVSERSKENPISILSPAAQQIFSESLLFCNEALSSFNYAALKQELTPEQIYQVLSLFGQEDAVAHIPGEQLASLASTIATTAKVVRTSNQSGFSWIPDFRCEINGICYYSPDSMCNSISCRPTFHIESKLHAVAK